VQFQRFGEGYELRLEAGERLMETITRFAEQQSISFAALSGLGAVRQVRLAYFNIETLQYETHDLEEQLEALSLIGNVSLRDGRPFVHLHGSFGRRDLSVLGGHVMEGIVRPTIEMWLRPEEVGVNRAPDEESGLALLDLPERL
jgi:predicted DNA-binding protein with PD1-like motif